MPLSQNQRAWVQAGLAVGLLQALSVVLALLLEPEQTPTSQIAPLIPALVLFAPGLLVVLANFKGNIHAIDDFGMFLIVALSWLFYTFALRWVLRRFRRRRGEG
jgi:hypothetical protein